jgi:type I restriction enzyme R subunit
MTGRVDLLVAALRGERDLDAGRRWYRLDPRRPEALRPWRLRRPRPAPRLPDGHAARLVDKLSLETDTPTRRQFLARLEKEVGKRGVIDVLRKGIDHGPLHVDLFYGTPSPGNDKAAERFACNRFSVTRQLALQPRRHAARARPGAVHQRPAHRDLRAEEQPHQADRRGRGRAVPPRSGPARAAVRVRPLRRPLRRRRQRGAVLHRAQGQGLVVPPVQQGLQRRRRQPAEPERAQDLLPLGGGPHAAWADRHPRELRADRRAEGPPTGKKKQKQVFPRFHQLDVVRKLLADAREVGAGALPHPALGGQRQVQLDRLARAPAHRGKQSDGKDTAFDSIIVVTDRRILDEQIQANIKQFAQVSAVVGAVTGSGTRRRSSSRSSWSRARRSSSAPSRRSRSSSRRSGRAPRATLRDHHRRGALQPGRQDRLGDERALGRAADDPEDVVNDET